MAILKIYVFPSAMLAKKAKPIERIEQKHQKLAEDMLETMYDAPGIGLAANQVGILEQMIIIDTHYEIEEFKDDDSFDELENKESENNEGIIINKNPMVMINPKIIYKEGHIAISEGCLSVPDYTAEVDRAKKIKVEYTNLDGLTKTLSAEELLSVCIQHEIDHLEGKLFIDRISPLKQEVVKKKLRAGKKLNTNKKKSGLL